MIKQCVICGASFSPLRHLEKIQECCSKTCSAVSYKRKAEEKRWKHRAEINKRHREYCDKNKPRYCDICGEQIIRSSSKMRTHDECLIRKCGEYLRKRERLPDYWYRKLYNRGYTQADVLTMTGIKRNCLYCGEKLEGQKFKYCSKQCRDRHYKERRSVVSITEITDIA